MKKALCKFMAVVMILSVLVGIVPAVDAKAADVITPIPVTAVNDITYEVVNAATVGDTIAVGTTSYTKQYQFTLAKPAYVVMSVYSTVCKDGSWSALDTISYRLSYNQAGNSIVRGTYGSTKVDGSSESKQYLVLDAGTYYLTTEMSSDDGKSYGSYKISMLAQYSNAVTRNVTREKAVTVGTDRMNTGMLTATTRNSWYKFSVSSTTTVSITSCLNSAWSTNNGRVLSDYMATTLWDSRRKPVSFWNIPKNYGESYTANNITLKPGTYYLSFYGGQTYRFNNWEALGDSDNEKVSNICNGGEVSFKITTIKAPGSVKAVNQRGKKVKVIYRKSAGANGYELQCSTNKKFTSGVKKASTKSTAYTFTKLKKGKTYYVRVRSWKYDMEGNKLISSWVVKAVKVRK